MHLLSSSQVSTFDLLLFLQLHFVLVNRRSLNHGLFKALAVYPATKEAPRNVPDCFVRGGLSGMTFCLGRCGRFLTTLP
jgi:hypothetical protein